MDAQWPPSGEDFQVLEELSLLIEKGGAGHFLDAPVVRADERDFPEEWSPTRACLERLLLRLFWLTYVDLDVAVADLRTGRFDPSKILRRSAIDWIETREGTAVFQLEEIGNDNVAGHLAHEVGRAFAAWVEGPPLYRDAEPAAPTSRQASVAAVYLGLGVVATNASQYHRLGAEQRGREAVTEWEVVTTGGLSPRHLLLLLAVQAVLRGKLEEAHHTLRADLLDELRGLVATLTPRRKEIADHLGLDLSAPRPALERDERPATVSDSERPEKERKKRFEGMSAQRTMQHRLFHGVAIGLVSALLGLALSIWLVERGHLELPGSLEKLFYSASFVAPMALAMFQGWKSRYPLCGACLAPISPLATTCATCGATLVSPEELRRLREETEEREVAELAQLQAEIEAQEQQEQREQRG